MKAESFETIGCPFDEQSTVGNNGFVFEHKPLSREMVEKLKLSKPEKMPDQLSKDSVNVNVN